MIEDFKSEIKNYIDCAYNLTNTCPYGNYDIKMDVNNLGELDGFVEMLRDLYQNKKGLDKEQAWEMAVVFGTFLGEAIIKKHKFNWVENSEHIPVVETNYGNQLSPITKIYKIITSKSDDEGSPSGFYNGYLTLEKYHNMSDEEKEKITVYVDTDK